jgi:acylphosphatase
MFHVKQGRTGRAAPEESAMKAERGARLACRISGRVQGVGFRWWVRRRAVALGLRGSVQNLPDGSVRVDAEGEPEALRQLHQLLQVGPAAARVDRLELLDPLPGPFPADFQITT